MNMKESIENSKHESHEFELILSSLNTGLSVINSDLTISWVNKKTYEMFPEGNPIGKICYRFYESSDEPCEHCPTIQCFKSGRVHELEKYNPVRKKWYRIISQPLKYSDGQVFSVLEGVTEITERKQTEIRLAENEKNMSTILNNTNDVVVRINRDFKHIFANSALYTVTGLTPEEYLGKTNEEIGMPEQLCSFWKQKHQQVFATGKSDYFEFSYPTVDKGDRTFQAAICPEFNDNSEVETIISFMRDITEQKHIEEELKASEQKYRNISESMPGLILKYKLNPDGSDQLLYISKGVEDLYEIQREDAVRNNALLWDRVHRDDLEEYRALVKKSAENLSFWELEHRLKMPDGRVKWVHNRGVPIKQEDGSIVWDSLAVDITERKQAVQALKNSRQLLRNIIDTSTDYIFVKDKNLKTVLCNKTFAKAVNKDPADLIGKTDIENGWDAELVKGNPEKGVKGYEKNDLEALSGKSVKNTDIATIYGETLFLDSVKIPLKDENNEIFGVLGISRDITEQKKLEQEKDHLIDELKLALSKVKKLEGFLPICSHCKKIRDDKGYWNQIEGYIRDHSDAEFSHSICPECAVKYYPDMNIYDE